MNPAESAERCMSEQEVLHNFGELYYTRLDEFPSALEGFINQENETAREINSYKPLRRKPSRFMLPMPLRAGGLTYTIFKEKGVFYAECNGTSEVLGDTPEEAWKNIQYLKSRHLRQKDEEHPVIL